jgi:8-oxo-dGTP pyrophosphatase MutT (NUDIX family)
VIAGGVAIFHLASSRVVLCRHSVADVWFLPKGRRDVGEDSIAGAEREGFEEVSRKTEWLAGTN